MSFSNVLDLKIEEYFRTTGKTPYADTRMWFKITFWIVVWVTTWSIAVLGNHPLEIRTFFGFLHILSHIFIALNIAHDANHRAISPHRWVNRLLSYSFDLVGGSSLVWRLTHNYSHHGYINVEGADVGADGRGIVRFTAYAPWKPFHRFQHLYSPFLYCLVVLNVVFVKDFQVLYSFLRNKRIQLRKSELIAFFAFKAFYFLYVLVLPCLILPYSALQIFSIYVLSQMVAGQFLIFIQMGHLNEFAEFPSPANSKAPAATDDSGVLRTTCDFGASNVVGGWLIGCINIHTIHHLRPDICHVHYRDLLPLVTETAGSFGLRYVSEPKILRGYSSHYRLLKLLGQPNC